MVLNELVVSSKEQTVTLSNGCFARIEFDAIYKRWYYNLYIGGELAYAGISLTPDTSGLLHITRTHLGLVDLANDKYEYEPYNELGSRLGLMEAIEG